MTSFTDNDRKMIIQHDIKLTQICKTLQTMDNKITKVGDKIDDNNKTFVTRKLFLSINGVIVVLLIGLFAYFSTINTQVIENTTSIKYIEEKLERK